jgi:hypothetical protein
MTESRIKCVVCEEPLDELNFSEEHLILEAIGGRFKVKQFICRSCNNNAGDKWDAELVSQLHPLRLLFGVKRQRGVTPGLAITTTAGEDLWMKPEGGFVPAKPSYSESLTDKGIAIQFTTRTMAEARKMLAGVKRKYPRIDVDQVLGEATTSTAYPAGLVQHQLEFGGELSGRSIVKSALALAYHNKVSSAACADALQYLRDPTALPCFGYYQKTDLVRNRPPETPLHCVALDANPASGLVLCYVEYFGVHRLVVCLGKNYTGDRIQACYAIDPRTAEQLPLSICLDFSEAEIESIYKYEMIPQGSIEKAFNAVMPAALKRKSQAEKDRAIEEAIEYAFKNCGAEPGGILTQEQVRKVSLLVAEKLTPFLMDSGRQKSQTPPSVPDKEVIK